MKHIDPVVYDHIAEDAAFQLEKAASVIRNLMFERGALSDKLRLLHQDPETIVLAAYKKEEDKKEGK